MFADVVLPIFADGVLDEVVGPGLGATGSGGGTDPLAPSAPTLTWATGTDDNTPDFYADFVVGEFWAAGDITGSNYDVIDLQVATNIAFTSPTTASNTVDALELMAGELTFPAVGPLADGTWYARARSTHYVGGVAHVGAWSNTVTQTIVTANYRISATGDRRISATGDIRKAS